MVKAKGEITVAGKCYHETVVRNVVPNIGLDSFMDDLNSADSRCEVLFHVNKQSLDFASGVHVDTADVDIDEDGQDIMLGYAGDETENAATSHEFDVNSFGEEIERRRAESSSTAPQHPKLTAA